MTHFVCPPNSESSQFSVSVSGIFSCRSNDISLRDGFSFRDAHYTVTQTGKPNYLVARVPVPSALNISSWRNLLQGYKDIIVCNFLEFGWPVGFLPDTLPICDRRTHRGALQFPDHVTAYLYN